MRPGRPHRLTPLRRPDAHRHPRGRGGRAGKGTMYVIDLGTHNEGRAALKLYDVEKHGGTRYFSRLRVSGAKTENGVR
jgi:hypothetical protein